MASSHLEKLAEDKSILLLSADVLYTCRAEVLERCEYLDIETRKRKFARFVSVACKMIETWENIVLVEKAGPQGQVY